jgi:diaminopimelate dehydrogenase
MRLYFSSFLPNSSVNTFWGRGVSQGHSEALRRIDGVIDAVQYTVPREDALTLASLVSHPLSSAERHRRVCYIVAEKGKEDSITCEVLNMENYFADYEVELHFISAEKMRKYHGAMTHRGRIYALGMSGKYKEVKHSAYLDLDIGSNPDLTASIMLAGARAAHSLSLEKQNGAYTVFDIPPSYFTPIKCNNVNNYL